MPAQSTLSIPQRLLALVIALALAAPLVVACTLEASASGMGTHRQLGLPACTWPIAFGLPCVTCGMTTAFVHLVHGEPLAAFRAQPAGAALALSAAIGVVVCAWDAVTARPMHVLLTPFARGRTAWVVAALLVAGWGWKILQSRGGGA